MAGYIQNSIKSDQNEKPEGERRSSYTLKPGLDLSLDIKSDGYGNHRSGWAYSVKSLMPLHNTRSVYFVSTLEKLFLWGKPKPVQFPRPWIGVTHRPPNIPTFLPEKMQEQFYMNEYFQDVLPGCRGIFTLSRYHAKHIQKEMNIPVCSLVHPTEIPCEQWQPETLKKRKLKVVQVGWWLRNLHAIFMLPNGDYEKIYLTKRKHEPVDQHFKKEAEHLVKNNLFKESMYENVITLDYLTNEEYDQLLATSVVFIELYDASANNTVIESIARATPILINPLEAVVEYLGKDYPFYYNTYEEAVEKLHNEYEILKTHHYLKNCATRRKISGEYFKKTLEESKIYKDLYPFV